MEGPTLALGGREGGSSGGLRTEVPVVSRANCGRGSGGQSPP